MALLRVEKVLRFVLVSVCMYVDPASARADVAEDLTRFFAGADSGETQLQHHSAPTRSIPTTPKTIKLQSSPNPNSSGANQLPPSLLLARPDGILAGEIDEETRDHGTNFEIFEYPTRF